MSSGDSIKKGSQFERDDAWQQSRQPNDLSQSRQRPANDPSKWPEFAELNAIAREIEKNLQKCPATQRVFDWVAGASLEDDQPVKLGPKVLLGGRDGLDRAHEKRDFLSPGVYGDLRGGTFRLWFYNGFVRFRPDEKRVIAALSPKAINAILKLDVAQVCGQTVVGHRPDGSPILARGVGVVAGIQAVLQNIQDTVRQMVRRSMHGILD